MLFSDASLHTLGFIKAGQLDADKFIKLIEEAKPSFIFDLRPVPSFARRTLTRDAVFALFDKHGVRYHDVAGVLGVSAGRDALLNPSLLIRALQVSVLHRANGLTGPVFFFVNSDLFTDEYFSAVAKHLPHLDSRGWEIACWPNEPILASHQRRDLVFISHANPEDNDIALWLASRLAGGGYQVWSDVTRLIGGEVLWDTIEDAIRNRAAKVIVILSRRGHQKSGLLDEINIAVATERNENLDRFVIPVRVDDLPFIDIRANLARKNVIDGHRNLADALSKLFAVLREDDVPRVDGDLHSIFQELQSRKPPDKDRSEWSLLVENKIEIVKWPRAIRKFRSTNLSYSFPTYPTSKGIVTFEDWNSIQTELGSKVNKAGEAAFELGEASSALDLVFDSRNEARQAVASFLRQAWNRNCESRGFAQFVLANESSCWFLPNDSQNANRVRYLDPKGVERHRNLVGQSLRRGVFWHFAIEARPNVTDSSIRLVPHVVFSEDGKNPITSHDRQHSLRRGFCRNWWNARWRDLLTATLSYLAEGRDKISLPVSTREAIETSSSLKTHLVEPNDDRNIESGKSVIQFEEPMVAVGHGQTDDYPKEGLLLFGPVAFERNPKEIRVGVIGTPEGIGLFHVWSRQFNTFQSDPGESRNAMPFPGFEAVFGAKWEAPVHTIALSRTELISAIVLEDRHLAIFKSSGMYVERITKAVHEDDVDVNIWFVVIPDEVFLYGRPASRVPSSIVIATPEAMGRYVARRFLGSSPSLFPEDNEEAAIYDNQLNFHHQLKARLLGIRAVTQILRESSLATTIAATVSEGPLTPNLFSNSDLDLADPDIERDEITGSETDSFDYTELSEDEDDEMRQVRSEHDLRILAAELAQHRDMQDKASVAWNLSTAAFFKSGGRPWRVANARPGVCYIGLIFKRDLNVRSRQACCGAQMFLQDSEGLVFKGAMGPWYSPETGQFHLSRTEATSLISSVLQSYAIEHRDPPGELFIHGRTRFNSEEWAGFCDAMDVQRTRLVAVRITRGNEYKLFSSGERAVRRGTAIQLNSRLGLLWTAGFIERLGTYPGRETPNPLRIEIVNDTERRPSIETVMGDIMMLTKMNFNSCIYADGLPVTMRFADAIGDVMITAKEKVVPPLPFRYYI